MELGKELEFEVGGWSEVSVHPHRFGGREFLFGKAEIGHVHSGGLLDIPFTRPIHDALIDEGLAERHHWVPDSGWVSFRVRTRADLKHALWLMRLSYLRFSLKTSANPREVLGQEGVKLSLSPVFESLLEAFIPKNANLSHG